MFSHAGSAAESRRFDAFARGADRFPCEGADQLEDAEIEEVIGGAIRGIPRWHTDQPISDPHVGADPALT